jgi:hypothetical protein
MVLETISHALQSKEEKNIVANKKHQLCALLLHISQDLISGNGYKLSMFWESIQHHYKYYRPLANQKNNNIIEIEVGN